MKRFAALGAGIILLGGCAIPVPVQVASWALDGISYLLTEKSVADHGISVLAQKDCALLRGLIDSGEICRDFDDTATALADGGSYGRLFVADGADDAAAIAEFENAAAGPAGEPDEMPSSVDVTEEGARTNARPILDDGVATAAAVISASVAFEDSASLDEYPADLVVLDGAVDGLSAQQAALGDVEELALDREVAAIVDWKAQAARVVETGNEPAAGLYFVIGSFREHDNARKLRTRYRALTPSVLSAKLDKATVFRVVVGPFDQDKAKDIHRQIFKAGIADSWAIRVNPGEWSMAMVDPPAFAPIEVAVLGRSVEELADGRPWSAVRYIRSLAQLAVD